MPKKVPLSLIPTWPLKRTSGVMAQSGHRRKERGREREGAKEERGWKRREGEGIVKSSFDAFETKLKKSPGAKQAVISSYSLPGTTYLNVKRMPGADEVTLTLQVTALLFVSHSFSFMRASVCV